MKQSRECFSDKILKKHSLNFKILFNNTFVLVNTFLFKKNNLHSEEISKV